jgi:hypothetical protein
MNTHIACPRALPDIEHYTYKLALVTAGEPDFILKHPPRHGSTAASTLELDMQEDVAAVLELDFIELVGAEGIGGKFSVKSCSL